MRAQAYVYCTSTLRLMAEYPPVRAPVAASRDLQKIWLRVSTDEIYSIKSGNIVREGAMAAMSAER